MADHQPLSTSTSNVGLNAAASDLIFSTSGSVRSQEEMASRARRKGLCPSCGVKVQERRGFLQFPITNENVFQGICIRCCPNEVPSGLLREWEQRNRTAVVVPLGLATTKGPASLSVSSTARQNARPAKLQDFAGPSSCDHRTKNNSERASGRESKTSNSPPTAVINTEGWSVDDDESTITMSTRSMNSSKAERLRQEMKQDSIELEQLRELVNDLLTMKETQKPTNKNLPLSTNKTSQVQQLQTKDNAYASNIQSSHTVSTFSDIKAQKTRYSQRKSTDTAVVPGAIPSLPSSHSNLDGVAGHVNDRSYDDDVSESTSSMSIGRIAKVRELRRKREEKKQAQAHLQSPCMGRRSVNDKSCEDVSINSASASVGRGAAFRERRRIREEKEQAQSICSSPSPRRSPYSAGDSNDLSGEDGSSSSILLSTSRSAAVPLRRQQRELKQASSKNYTRTSETLLLAVPTVDLMEDIANDEGTPEMQAEAKIGMFEEWLSSNAQQPAPVEMTKSLVALATSTTLIVELRIRAIEILQEVVKMEDLEAEQTSDVDGAVNMILSQAVIVSNNSPTNVNKKNQEFVQEASNLLWTYVVAKQTEATNRFTEATLREFVRNLVQLLRGYKHSKKKDFVEAMYVAIMGALSAVTGQSLGSRNRLSLLLQPNEVNDLIDSIYVLINSGKFAHAPLAYALTVLNHCCSQDAHEMVNLGVVVVVVDIMGERLKSLAIQQKGSSILALLAAMNNLHINLSIVDSEGIERVCKALSEYPDNEEVQINGFRCLRYLASSDRECKTSVLARGGIGMAVRATKTHHTVPRVLESTCDCLHELTMDLDPTSSRDLFAENFVETLVQVQAESLKRSCLGIMENMLLADSTRGSRNLVEAGAIHTVLSTCQEHMNSASLVEQSLRVLYLLVRTGNETKIRDADGVFIITSCMHVMMELDCEAALLQGCKCLGALASKLQCNAVQVEGGIGAIVMAMTCYLGNKEIQIAACRALEDNAATRQREGSESTISADEVNALVTILSCHTDSHNVMEASCKALRQFVSDPRNRNVVLGCGNEVLDVLEVVKAFSSDAYSEIASEVLDRLRGSC